MNDAKTRLEFDKVLERMAAHASFSLGKQRVLDCEPSFSSLIVERDLARMTDALALEWAYGSLSFGGISDVSGALQRAGKQAVLSVEEIVTTGRFMQGSLRLKQQFYKLETDYRALDDLFISLDVDRRLVDEIDRCFADNFEVLDQASPVLGHIRKNIRSLLQTIEVQSQKFLQDHKNIVSENVVSFRHGRRTFLIKPAEKNKLDGIITGESASGQSVYFEPAFLARLHNELTVLQNQESEEIERICRHISRQIAQSSGQLEANLATCALLDEIFAKARWGKSNDAVVATLTSDTFIIKNARHPLIDRNEVVANTYRMVPPYKLVLISGPNTGGKSVSLKTIGLSVLMTLSGCPVCADEAQVMLVDQIFVDIGDQQSIEKSLSSFSAHIETMKTVYDNASEKSLVLLDELGSQTDPLEGESLSMAFLDHFRSVGCWVVATTHFSRLKKYGTQHEDILISSVEFDLDRLSPTYRYRENVSGESNALEIAQRIGLDASLIETARTYKKESQYEADHLLEILEEKIRQQDDLNETLAQKQRAIEASEQETQEKKHTLQHHYEQKMAELMTQNEETVMHLIEQASQQLEIINQTQRPDLRQEAFKEIKKLKPAKPPVALQVGDRVRLSATQQIGIIESIEKNTAFISIGQLKVKVDVSQLSKTDALPKAKKVRPKTHSVTRPTSVRLECNVIGKRVEEALPIIDKYLDECVLNRITICRIVHGHGTGKLRTAVHDYLRKHKQVASFVLAPTNEGGSGATVVTLKS